ncbi:MAG: hypothetical protein RAP70_06530 [Candidatus Celaenobacter antarcticus]|nr:hypothetical protein [Candidatus Celaenobacter antarcticus]
MAGILLLISKSPEKKELFKEKTEKLIKYTDKIFKPYFKEISYHRPSEQAFIIIFKNDSRNKFAVEKSGSWLAYEGSIFALHKTKAYSAEELLDLYHQKGEYFINDLDGHFVIKLYDKAKDQYLIFTDFIRSRINYFAESKDFVMFTPYILLTGIIKNTEEDLHALNEMFWRYYILSSRTLFNDVTRLDSASIYRFHNRKIEIKKYWNFPTHQTNNSFEESVTKFVASIKETALLVNSYYGKPVMDLTQGQDSRIIMAAFRSQDLPFSTTTFGKEDFLELKNTKKMARKYKFDHHGIEITEDFKKNIIDYFDKSLILGNGDEPGYLLGRILFMREKQAKFGNVLINGTGGPFYKDCFWEEVYTLNLYREPRRLNYESFLRLRPMNKNYPDRIFTENFLKVKNKSAEYFIDMINESIDSISDCPVSMQIDKFALTKWQNYAIISNNISLSTNNSISPLLLRRNLEIGLAMPARWRWNKSNFQRAVMYRLDPELAKEKTDFGGINMVPYNIITFIPFYAKYIFRQSQRYRNKILNRLGFNVKTHLQAAWDYKPIYESLFDKQEIQTLLNYNDMNLSSIIKKDEWQQFINKFTKCENISLSDYEFVLKIASIELLIKKAAILRGM